METGGTIRVPHPFRRVAGRRKTVNMPKEELRRSSSMMRSKSRLINSDIRLTYFAERVKIFYNYISYLSENG